MSVFVVLGFLAQPTLNKCNPLAVEKTCGRAAAPVSLSDHISPVCASLKLSDVCYVCCHENVALFTSDYLGRPEQRHETNVKYRLNSPSRAELLLVCGSAACCGSPTNRHLQTNLRGARSERKEQNQSANQKTSAAPRLSAAVCSADFQHLS